MIEVFTDGALSRGGVGGWAWWINDLEWRSGGERDTTNQRMEMIAVIDALYNAVEDGWNEDVRIVSDSAYVVNCFRDKWYLKWFETNWKNGRVKNQDLWQKMFSWHGKLCEEVNVEWKHVRGHGKGLDTSPRHVFGNDMADRLAVEAKQRMVENLQLTVMSQGAYGA